MPTTLCTIANALAMIQNSNAWPVPARSSATLALMPIEVKNAVINADCKLVSKLITTHPDCRAMTTKIATTKPPTTAAGMLWRRSTGTRRSNANPRKSASPPAANVGIRSSLSMLRSVREAS